MFSLQELVRKNIAALEPYTSARSEFKGNEGIFLDANENPYGAYNRYPDPIQQQLKQAFSQQNQVPITNIFIGNGSDEIIDLSLRIFCNPGIDKALTFSPTYGMYSVAAALNDVELVTLPLNEYFQIVSPALSPWLEDEHLKMLFICSPNNPTGNCLEGIEKILQQFKGIVVVDEAYIDFADAPSFIPRINDYPNLIVVQTLSKAWGMAAARIGIAYAQQEIIALLNKIKPPYNISTLNQKAALEALSDQDTFEANKIIIRKQRAWLEMQLKKLSIVKKVYPSEANFLLVEITDANAIYKELIKHKVITRNRHSQVNNCIRITVGSPEENLGLIHALEQIALSLQTQTKQDEKSTLY